MEGSREKREESDRKAGGKGVICTASQAQAQTQAEARTYLQMQAREAAIENGRRYGSHTTW